MTTVISSFKALVAKRARVKWQRDFFEHRLRGDESLDEKANYIRMNPVRKGLVGDPGDWPWKWEPWTDHRGGPSGPALSENWHD